jgi:integrase
MPKRRSKQKGILKEKGDHWMLRYELRDASKPCGWAWKREYLPDMPRPEAELYQKRRMEVINRQNNNALAEPTMTLQRFVETLWLEYLDIKQVGESTRYSYDSMLRGLILRNFGQYKLDMITSVRLSQFFAAVGKKYSSKYTLNLFALLNTILDLAVDYELLTVSPLKKKLHKPTGVTSPEKEAYTAEQIQTIVEHIPEEHRLLILVPSIMSGPRAGELLGFRWGDLKENVLSIKHTLWRGHLRESTKTKASKSRVAVPPVLATLLAEHREKSEWNRDEDYIFTRPDGRPHDPDLFREQVLYPALKAAGIVIKKRQNGFHAFRHSAGSLLYEATRDLQQAKEFLRHARISTTSDIYLHVGEAVRAEGTQALAGMILGGDVTRATPATSLAA